MGIQIPKVWKTETFGPQTIEWNVMQRIWQASNFYFFARAYFSLLLELLPCLQAWGRRPRDCNNGSNTNHSNTGPVIRKLNGVYLSIIQMVGLSGVQMAFENWTNWHQTSFWPFKYGSSWVFRSPVYFFYFACFLV